MLQIKQVPPTFPDLGVKIDIPALAYIGIDDGEIVGRFGLAWGYGRCWIWLTILKSKPEYAITVMHRAKHLIAKAAQFGEEAVFTPRDTHLKTSEKLLTVLGFTFFAEENGIEVWRHVRL